MSLRAPWLGSWKAPWNLGRGRRWNDLAWVLASISQAWLLGGRNGQWPQASWVSDKFGPSIEPLPGFTPTPDRAWISLLRHGSKDVQADRRGKKEDELRAWCWQALLDG
ncbi:MAG: hypothetical protein Q8O00_08040, partial [Holophaga sp.]|nr:hypothetical protein [Holophaga sp.]